MNVLGLKLFAVLTMTIDHLGIVLNTLHNYRMTDDDLVHFTSDEYWYMRVIGRLAFPVFCFLIAEGCAHTKSIGKYILRLAVFALISQLPFQMFLQIRHGITPFGENWFIYNSGNVIITLALGALVVFFYSMFFKTNFIKRLLCGIGIIAAFLTVLLLDSEYDIYGLLLILLIYAFRAKSSDAHDSMIYGNKYMQIITCTALTFACYFFYYNQMRFTYLVLGATMSFLPLLLYNGKQAKRKMKWSFYVYYPSHLIVLFVIMYVYMTVM